MLPMLYHRGVTHWEHFLYPSYPDSPMTRHIQEFSCVLQKNSPYFGKRKTLFLVFSMQCIISSEFIIQYQ